MRRTLAQRAMLEAINIRSGAKLSHDGPLDVYDLSQKLCLRVRFVGVSMEGMYKRGRPPRILLSALRPQLRRVYTCAHEIGHHVFKHGSTIDELVEDQSKVGPLPPEEALAQSFAGFLLMPALAVRKAFTERGWRASEASPAQLLTVASAFGVGYTTLINHLAYALDMLPHGRATQLLKVPPSRIRRDLVGTALAPPLIVVDGHWELPTVDAEVGTHILLPPGTTVAGDLLAYRADTPHGPLFEAIKPGIVRADRQCSGWAAFVRICRFQYVGLSEYRHLEDDGDDE
jgi:Zn-dependent peptidase ImmA (M78 family)